MVGSKVSIQRRSEHTGTFGAPIAGIIHRMGTSGALVRVERSRHNQNGYETTPEPEWFPWFSRNLRMRVQNEGNKL